MQAVVGSTRSSANSANLRFRVNFGARLSLLFIDPPEAPAVHTDKAGSQAGCTRRDEREKGTGALITLSLNVDS